MGLTVGNPEGFSTPYAVKIDRISLTLDVKSLKDEKKIVRDITVENADIYYETGLSGPSNIKTIQNNINAAVPKSEGETKLQIDKLTFSGATLIMALAGLTTFAAMLVDSVATDSATSETMTEMPPPIFPRRTVGSQIDSP